MFRHNGEPVSLDGDTHRSVKIAGQLRDSVIRGTKKKNFPALISTQNQGAPELIQDVGHLWGE